MHWPHPNVHLRVTDVEKTYLRGSEQVRALKGVSLCFSPGHLTVITGPSGCGKSTLLHILGGMDRSTSGHVYYGNSDISQWTSNQLASYRRNVVGFIFQSFYLLEELTVYGNMELPLIVAGKPLTERSARVKHVLQRMGLVDRKGHYPSQISGGQAQRVAIARAIVSDAPIILADEPTGNLDSQTAQDIFELLSTIAHEDQRIVIVVTHNEELAALADRVIRMRDGEVLSDNREIPLKPPSKESSGAPATGGATMQWRHIIRMAWKNIAKNRTRTLLTAVGIGIGVASLVLLIGMGNGIKHGVVSTMENTGPLTEISVTSNPLRPNLTLTKTTLEEFDQIKNVVGSYFSPLILAQLVLNRTALALSVQTLPPQALWKVPGLRPHTAEGHLARTSSQLVLSTGTAESLSNSEHRSVRSLLGQPVTLSIGSPTSSGEIRFIRRRFRIVGITNSASAYITYRTMLSLEGGHATSRSFSAATVVASNTSHVSFVSKKITQLGFTAQNSRSTLGAVKRGFGLIEVGLGIVGGIALLVAGLMIGLVTSMTVLERRQEIGILRAIGSRRMDIFRLFLTHVLIVGLVGGLGGLFVSGIMADLIDIAVAKGVASQLFAIPLWLMALGLMFALGVSALAGIPPALKAAALPPVDALERR